MFQIQLSGSKNDLILFKIRIALVCKLHVCITSFKLSFQDLMKLT